MISCHGQTTKRSLDCCCNFIKSANQTRAGNISSPFNISVGCRHGDPLSGPLFLLAVEILCIELRSSPNLKWFTVEDVKLLLSLYDDDVTMFRPMTRRAYDKL